jgi:hypothetical protein
MVFFKISTFVQNHRFTELLVVLDKNIRGTLTIFHDGGAIVWIAPSPYVPGGEKIRE